MFLLATTRYLFKKYWVTKIHLELLCFKILKLMLKENQKLKLQKNRPGIWGMGHVLEKSLLDPQRSELSSGELFLYSCSCVLKFIYSEKATTFCEIFTLLLSYVVPVKSKVKISQNFVAFSEYMNFKERLKRSNCLKCSKSELTKDY